MMLALESTQMSPPSVSLSSATASAAGLSTIVVRSQGASPRLEENTTLSVSTSHLAKATSRGSAPSISMTVGQKPRNPSAFTRPMTPVVAGSQSLVRWSRATSVTAYGTTQLMSTGLSGAA